MSKKVGKAPEDKELRDFVWCVLFEAYRGQYHLGDPVLQDIALGKIIEVVEPVARRLRMRVKNIDAKAKREADRTKLYNGVRR